MLYMSAMDHARKLNSAVMFICHSEKCRRGFYFRACVLYFRFETCKDVNIKQLCSSSVYKCNL